MRRHHGFALCGLVGGLAWMAVGTSRVDGAVAQPYVWNPSHTCTFCHDPHGNANPKNLKDEDVEVLCLTCHGPGGTSELKADTHEGHTCLDCHSPHKDLDNWLGGLNRKMVGRDHGGLARIQTDDHGLREVVFESLGTDAGEPSLHSFSDDDEDGNGVWDGVCEVCHSSGQPSENHNFGRTCTVCHLHEDGFEEP